ncbi:CD63 antigen-like [Antedon mediterranea]|uniref:CD63 antigen-like n=1 Tax=Antedon mediterranea TaxID=105859 RepID=UPI003AF57800
MVNCSRILLIFVNLIILIIGICAIGMSWYVLSHSTNLPAELQFLQGAKIVTFAGLVLGAFLFVIGLTGGFGAAVQNVTLLKTYIFILSLVVTLQLAVGIYIAVMNEEKVLLEVWKKMDEVSIDVVQSQMNCCGFNSTSEYSPGSVPDSCIDPDSEQLYDVSCYTRLWDLINDNLLTSSIAVSVVFLIEVFAILFAGRNVKHIKNRISYTKGIKTAWEL